ncbi:YafY family transcriptional regulator [Paenibacillus sp. SC116]|uniref:helix-turn-helix transcriptional regulator n=1 Tax=Paenibacillus sp. SC116 TaxID=2968986 RepID=UPI00215AB9DA|nr:YafY family protein [Paenibacillus sp. SC116]MCR8844619.1 YafY family transcriptional regulator [Paenibacillus sp. SC116]
MKRSDRLTAIVMALQQQSETAQSLADKFEVSKRTILRDMQTLSEMGVPLYGESGPRGGYKLMEGYHLPPLALSEEEALLTLVALQGMTQLADSPFNAERWTVMDKLKHALAPSYRSQLDTKLERMELFMPKRSYRTPYLTQLLEAAVEGHAIEAFYRSMRHERWLKLLPKRVYTANGFWYCEAYSFTHSETRSFRVDRVAEMHLSEEHAEINTAAAQQRGQYIASQDQASTKILNPDVTQQVTERVRIVARLTYRGMLQVEQDEHLGEQVHLCGDDSWELDAELPRSEWQWVVEWFYRLGMDAEVLEPLELRMEVAKLAAQVYARYEEQPT